MSDKGWKPGFTMGTSEGRWAKVDSGLMKYERKGTLTYGAPTTDAWGDGYERLFGTKAPAFCDTCEKRAAWCECTEASCPTPSTSS